jgi:putative NIF3 family GTP cyclohydrolase 1 type 2
VGGIRSTTRESLLQMAQRALGIHRLLVAGPLDGEVTRAAVGAGACGDLLNEVIASGAGFYLTGEMRHHDALKAAAAGVTVACALHSNSERPTLPRLAERLRAHLPRVHFELSVRDRDPFSVW